MTAWLMTACRFSFSSSMSRRLLGDQGVDLGGFSLSRKVAIWRCVASGTLEELRKMIALEGHPLVDVLTIPMIP